MKGLSRAAGMEESVANQKDTVIVKLFEKRWTSKMHINQGTLKINTMS